MNIYEKCPVLQNDRFIIRLTTKDDCDDLLEVYSDKNALPFFNSDNCNGDNLKGGYGGYWTMNIGQ